MKYKAIKEVHLRQSKQHGDLEETIVTTKALLEEKESYLQKFLRDLKTLHVEVEVLREATKDDVDVQQKLGKMKRISRAATYLDSESASKGSTIRGSIRKVDTNELRVDDHIDDILQ